MFLPYKEIALPTSLPGDCAAKFSSPLKQCYYLIKDISATYINSGRLCGEEDFAATRGLSQKLMDGLMTISLKVVATNGVKLLHDWK